MNINYVGANMPCGTLADGSYQGCSGAGTCYTSTGVALSSEMGTCKVPATDDGACDTAVGPGCLSPARCIPSGATGTAGKCTVPSGATCG